jgi:hypothetical protein
MEERERQVLTPNCHELDSPGELTFTQRCFVRIAAIAPKRVYNNLCHEARARPADCERQARAADHRLMADANRSCREGETADPVEQ